jgi:hypothetical protein
VYNSRISKIAAETESAETSKPDNWQGRRTRRGSRCHSPGGRDSGAGLRENQRAGQWIDRTEQVNLNELFERMTQEELEMYARDGQLPVWFTQTVVATPKDNQEVKNDT